jgi:hypothetical protein
MQLEYLKSPTDKPIHVALLNGNTISIGPDGREVPAEFLKQAVINGCIPAEMKAEDMSRTDAEPTEKEHATILREALLKLRAEDTPLTGAGLPNRNTVSGTVGWNVSAVELTDAWNALPPA